MGKCQPMKSVVMCIELRGVVGNSDTRFRKPVLKALPSLDLDCVLLSTSGDLTLTLVCLALVSRPLRTARTGCWVSLEALGSMRPWTSLLSSFTFLVRWHFLPFLLSSAVA